ncbi:general transcription factor IIF subunit 1 isoform X2 [Condylostylus longicornis]|uniref:general transcription factor IIF subunit 1 isoform X2 n=1 Tax=Condylostylus longicornis TaxID=2530218 RepID=UPI00244E1F1A|nr:general transcription factor IIF subunit 1 isoform X2 [Condylostylus longicornis]
MTPSRPQAVAHVQEFKIRVPKNSRKKHHVMRFNATLNVDFGKWNAVRMERENNMKEFKTLDEDMPKFGAGSEYNRDLREEVRRKKFGIIAKRYKPEAQPWILKVGGKSGKKFKGIREGGVSENAAFYVFTHAPDGAIEAYPLHEWYNFQPIQRYKSLSAEEAEQEFGRRRRVMNYFSLMLRRRLKADDEPEDPEEKVNAKGSGSKKSKELQISEMDEWIDSDEDSESEDEDKEKKKEDSDDEGNSKKKGKKTTDKKKKKDRDLEDEAFEESDNGDEEGRELDYISDSSEDEPDPESKVVKELISVGEEDALKSSESEEEEEKKSEESDEDDEEKKKEGKDKDKESKDKKKKKNKKKSKDEKKDSSSDFSSDSSESDLESKTKKKKEASTSGISKDSRGSSPAVSSQEANKRKFNNMPSDLTGSDNSNSPINTPAKKLKMETPSLPPTFAGVVNMNNAKDDFGITEEAVRRYLMRKPMTARELITKFKNKKNGVANERLVETMTQILKKINPVKQTIQGKLYLSIKAAK